MFEVNALVWTTDILKSFICCILLTLDRTVLNEFPFSDCLFTLNEKKTDTQSPACKHGSIIDYSLSSSIITL